jgi:N-acetylglucosaminyl-diphospho-decaprenol L-rhamnosyltransferase
VKSPSQRSHRHGAGSCPRPAELYRYCFKLAKSRQVCNLSCLGNIAGWRSSSRYLQYYQQGRWVVVVPTVNSVCRAGDLVSYLTKRKIRTYGELDPVVFSHGANAGLFCSARTAHHRGGAPTKFGNLFSTLPTGGIAFTRFSGLYCTFFAEYGRVCRSREGDPMPMAPTAPAGASPVAAPRLVRRKGAPVERKVQWPRLSIVIVNYRCWEKTGALVRQLMAAPATRQGDVEIVLVDNHSPPHPLLHRLRRCPAVAVRRWGRNRGFARAVNEGCRLSRGEWFLLLNPDVTIPDEFLPGVLRLVDRLNADEPRTGVIGFQLRNSDGTRQYSSGPFPTLAHTVARLLLPRKRRKYHMARPRKRCAVPWVTGCCLLVRRACLEELGGLDRGFFLYYEDVDFCRRAQQSGWAVHYEPALRVVHHGPLHSRPLSAYQRLLTRHALLIYARKHWPFWQFRVLTGIVAVEATVRRFAAFLRGDRTGQHWCRELAQIVAQLGRGPARAAYRRLDNAVLREELAVAV